MAQKLVVMAQKLAVTLTLIFTAISAARAGDTDIETIYNPNEPYPSGQEQQSVNNLVRLLESSGAIVPRSNAEVRVFVSKWINGTRRGQ